jgi:hypothetical protein
MSDEHMPGDQLSDHGTASIPVLDFRRRGVVLKWHTESGTWSTFDVPPPLVHGVALIRVSQPNICVYGRAGRLRLQVGTDQYALAENSPRISCTRGVASFGFRRRFTVDSSSGGVLFSHAYWTDRGMDFFRWLAIEAANPDWRVACARQWSDGISGTALRAA